MMKKTMTFIIFTFFPVQIWAEKSIEIDDWLITSDNTTCWASALIAEDPINDEYDPNKDFQITVSFHNRVPIPQFTITSFTLGKTVTSASVKFNEEKLDFVLVDSTAFSLPKDDQIVLSRFHLLSLLIDRTNQVKEGCVEAVKPNQIKLKETIIMLLEIDIEDGKYIRI